MYPGAPNRPPGSVPVRDRDDVPGADVAHDPERRGALPPGQPARDRRAVAGGAELLPEPRRKDGQPRHDARDREDPDPHPEQDAEVEAAEQNDRQRAGRPVPDREKQEQRAEHLQRDDEAGHQAQQLRVAQEPFSPRRDPGFAGQRPLEGREVRVPGGAGLELHVEEVDERDLQQQRRRGAAGHDGAAAPGRAPARGVQGPARAQRQEHSPEQHQPQYHVAGVHDVGVPAVQRRQEHRLGSARTVSLPEQAAHGLRRQAPGSGAGRWSRSGMPVIS